MLVLGFRAEVAASALFYLHRRRRFTFLPDTGRARRLISNLSENSSRNMPNVAKAARAERTSSISNTSFE
jgi:hypothetical protein